MSCLTFFETILRSSPESMMKYVSANDTMAVIAHTITSLTNEGDNVWIIKYGIIGRITVNITDGIITLLVYETYE